MNVSADPEAKCEILCRSNRFVPFEYSRRCLDGIVGGGEEKAYRGSCAEQRVVARLATNRTRKATRITTTPPTVSRSQRSELSRVSNSRFPVIPIVLSCNFTVLTNDCSDQDHKQTLCPWLAQSRNAFTKIIYSLFIERRFA